MSHLLVVISAYKCNPNMQFQCNSGIPRCIMLDGVCDGNKNCTGGEDELNCLGETSNVHLSPKPGASDIAHLCHDVDKRRCMRENK